MVFPLSSASSRQTPAWLTPFVGPAGLVLFMAVLHLLGNIGLLGSLDAWANSPRNTEHLSGILLFHLRHGSWGHWFSNAAPLIFLAGISRLIVPRAALRAWWLIPILSGVLLWMLGRSGGHIGASALTYGWFHFLLGIALWRRDRAALAGMFAAMMLYSGMIWAFVAPEGVSWEGHMAGAIAGHLGAWWWRRVDPMPKPLFSDDDEEDPPPFDLSATRPRDPF